MKLLVVTALSLLMSLSSVHGQSLSSLRVGDASSKLVRLGKPASSETYKDMTVQRWMLSDGNELSVTTDKSGLIVSVESDWNPGKRDDCLCGLAGVRFGVTTLTELRTRFGSNGFAFKERGGQLLAEDGAVMVNSYESGGVVITFYNKVQNAEVAGLDPDERSSIADHARLDAISIATPGYAKGEWGDRVYDPAYRAVVWK